MRLLIGFSQGSASDELMRLIQSELVESLRRPVFVEYMPGELGARAARETKTSVPDGNTLMVATLGTHAINPSLKADIGYDPVDDFSPICLAAQSPLLLGVSLSLRVNDVEELISLARRKLLTYGSSGVGSAPYMAGVLFRRQSGAELLHRSYSDTRMLYEDLAAGRLDISFNNAASMLRASQQGSANVIAVTSAARSTALLNVPTMTEAGVPGFALENWLGFVAPPKTSRVIIDAQQRAIVSTLRLPRIVQALHTNGIDPVGSTSDGFLELIKRERKRWRLLD